jgi:hypothetical protein
LLLVFWRTAKGGPSQSLITPLILSKLIVIESLLVAVPWIKKAGGMDPLTSRSTIDGGFDGLFAVGVVMGPSSSAKVGSVAKLWCSCTAPCLSIVGSPIHLIMCPIPVVSSGVAAASEVTAVSLLSHVGPSSGAKAVGLSAALSATIKAVIGPSG